MPQDTMFKKSCAELNKKEDAVVYRTRRLFQASDNLFYFIPKVDKRVEPAIANVYIKAGKDKDKVIFGGTCNVGEVQNLHKLDKEYEEEDQLLKRLVKFASSIHTTLLEIEYASIVDPDLVDYLTYHRDNFVKNWEKRGERIEQERKERGKTPSEIESDRRGAMANEIGNKMKEKKFTLSNEEVLLLSSMTGYILPPNVKTWVKDSLISVTVDGVDESYSTSGGRCNTFFVHFNTILDIAKKNIYFLILKEK